MATLHQTPKSHKNLIYIKGSVENILSRCDEALDSSGQRVSIDAHQISEASNALAEK